MSEVIPHHRRAFAAFSHASFRYFFVSRFLALVGQQMLALAVSQQVYEITHNPLDLGYIGLALFLPKISLTLVAGHVADRFNRKFIVLICRIVQMLLTLTVLNLSVQDLEPLWLFYLLVLAVGTTNAFESPASYALVPNIIPDKDFHNAITWNSTSLQLAFIAGPAVGGWIYALSGSATFVIKATIFVKCLAVLLTFPIVAKGVLRQHAQINWSSVMAGVRFVYQKKIILGAISLDLFAVLFGGAVALLPIFANDILHVGPKGLGVLRAAPFVGASLMSILLAYSPPKKDTGKTLLYCVALFGFFTIAFGLSKNFVFSVFCLLMLGAFDVVSVVIRGILVQTQTPEDMRGRVSAVNLVFIGASNELGEFESGVTAALFGTVPAVVLGGVGTLIVVALWARFFPQIRNYQISPTVIATNPTPAKEED